MVHGCAGAADDIKRTQLQLQKSFMFTGTLTPLGIHDYEATALYPDNHHYTPIARCTKRLSANIYSRRISSRSRLVDSYWSSAFYEHQSLVSTRLSMLGSQGCEATNVCPEGHWWH